VVNDVLVRGTEEPAMSAPQKTDSSLADRVYDVVIIGGGVTGCAIARELSRYDLRIAVLEKEDDVGCHASSRNDGMIHPGFAPTPGSLKAWFNSAGNRLYGELAEELGFRFERVGSIMLFSSPWLRLLLPIMWRRARRNNVDGPVQFLTRAKVRKLEPNVTRRQHGGLFFPSTGIVNPFEVTIAFAENAVQNGVEFHFETVVTGFDLEDSDRTISSVHTNRGPITAATVVNAAGCWSDTVAGLAHDRFFTIHGRRGVDVVLDKRLQATQRRALAMPDILGLSRTHSKGGGLIPSIHGNLIAGPTSEETPERENYATSPLEFHQVTHQLDLNDAVSAESIITYFAGVRPATFTEDFIVERSQRVGNLTHVAGIQSPGLASAPAIAVEAANLVIASLQDQRDGSDIPCNPGFNPNRPSRVDLSRLSLNERAELISSRPDYGRPVCRCEDVTEGEIRDALRSPLGVRSLDAIKRRTRAGAGRCHGGFCLPKLLEIIHDETGLPLESIRKKSGNSFLILGRTKTIQRVATHD
jgi:glycerol-3-phosphate dehydrogenase